ncbi:MAG: hypothetical protein M1823_003658 [Watsoniomyces obsoletus]|nr:MAG: hypothetical protein M1823_003658 [Watsoniomyces obsoletus]
MPLHLLGKKSWNVYNQDNVDRVRRDEAAAKAREEEEERRMQEVDAERRIHLLRGGDVAALPAVEDRVEDAPSKHDGRPSRKRKRIHGEDDTDRGIRYAKEDALLALSRQEEAARMRKPTSDAPLTDYKGHINLFPQERARSNVVKNPEAEAEAAKKKREYEDQYTMRFSNAAGFKQGLNDPWYASLGGKSESVETKKEERWGNDEHRRQAKQEARKNDDDPLASMRRGVQETKKIEKERMAWMEEREHELRQMMRLERGNRKRSLKRRKDEREEDELESFSLDAPAVSSPARSRKHEGHEGDSGRRRHRHHRGKDDRGLDRSKSRRSDREGDAREGRNHRLSVRS